MKLYPLIRPILFALPPEWVHKLTLSSLSYFDGYFKKKSFVIKESNPIDLMGIRFPHRVGLAAGLDKQAGCIDGLRRLGFSFIEVGTFTAKPQTGNPKPRLFRLKRYHALINRMNFNNPGIEKAICNIKQASYSGILGINIVKQSKTPNEFAIDDYLTCFHAFYPHADYISVNVSCPNTAGLRSMQKVASLMPLIESLKESQQLLHQTQGRYVPLVIKVSPDLTSDDMEAMAQLFIKSEVDGIIATNTTIKRPNHIHDKHMHEEGGLSGSPLIELSIPVVRTFRTLLGPKFPIIGSGGITTAADAKQMIAAGANLIQLYTGLIYQGPRLILECIRMLEND